MSVLIKGMEMPPDCEKCPFFDYEEGFCFASGIKGKSGWYEYVLRLGGIKDGRHDDCPLVPVPPHGLSDDVRSVVRGKWKHGVCQICFFDWSEVAPFASVPNYCPNCGADMREKR